MTQKIHGDLEVTGNLTVGGSAPGGGMTLLLELSINSNGPTTVETSASYIHSNPHHGSMRIINGARMRWEPSVAFDPLSMWDATNYEIVAQENGKYILFIPAMTMGTLDVGTYNYTALFIKRSGSSDYVPYAVDRIYDSSTGVESKPQSPTAACVLELEAEDRVRVGLLHRSGGQWTTAAVPFFGHSGAVVRAAPNSAGPAVQTDLQHIVLCKVTEAEA
jgi:hypothetical protein